MARMTSDQRDAATVITVGILAGAGVLFWGVSRAIHTFGSPLGIAWSIPIDEMPMNVTVGSSTGSVDVIVHDGTVHSDKVNPLSVTMIALSLVVSVLTALVVIACVLYLARSALRASMFTEGAVRAWNLIGWALIAGGVLMLFGDLLGGNGVLAAVGLQDAEVSGSGGFLRYAPMWAIGIACGLMSIAFRRGLRLQKDMEGLV